MNDNQYVYLETPKTGPEVDDEAHTLLEMAAINGALLAQKYFELEGDLDELHEKHTQSMALVASYDALVRDLRDEKQALIQRCQAFEAEVDDLVAAKRDVDGRHGRLQATCHSLQHSVQQLAAERADALDALRHAQDEASALDAVRSHLKASVETLQHERRALQNYVAEKDAQIRLLLQQEKAWRMTSDVQHQKIQRLERTVNDLGAHASELASALHAAHDQVASLRADVQAKQQELLDVKAAKAALPIEIISVPAPAAPTTGPSSATGMLMLLMWLSYRRVLSRRPRWMSVLSATVAKPQVWAPMVHQAWIHRGF
ncbi:hypothetical protein SPRG_03827 [Saprolegnia parasitica CBS 223.65]|uniref:Uncharacterized protein n=1 Tax=Saprolegnia parasitica (strain CBS 223.65) TaxID=695850 RepID=A0A067CKH0_SAPPC|nr:hypothetical protein SPRG_03827 [Saprolegnia parasitica CBS 223.65]KDO31209.1 hypothetical protein SPRG_03827 [Saprolegnia parasitica CBS 223.65]|eukprot:XP_012197814.1 hypothetical protein SPRG_03827 [Saprolegnia parasitica CBS 223.65]